MRVLLLGYKPDAALPILQDWLRPHAALVTLTGPMTAAVPYDWMISYRYHHVVPAAYLTPGRCINFHPGPPEYPGIGSTDWAIHNGARWFGVTAHHMAAVPDAGPIIAVERFPIWPRETVATLNQRAHAHLLVLADRILRTLRWLPLSDEVWVGPPRTRKQLDALCAIR